MQTNDTEASGPPTSHTADLDHALADALRETHSSFIEIDAVEKVDGNPVAYEVQFTYRCKVGASSAVDALGLAMAGLRAATGGAQ